MSRSVSASAKALLILMLTAASPLSSQTNLPAQTITFSSNKWAVRQTTEPEGPMANMFGGRDLSVFLNADGTLTLAIAYREGLWYAGEVTLQKRTGYGTYLFRLRTPPAGLDPNTVLGLFTYSSANAYFHREIDIEFSAWGQTKAPVLGQYVIQPYDAAGHMTTFGLSGIDGQATYSFAWREDKVEFASWKGYGPRPEAGSPALISAWTFSDPKAIPKPSANIHLNFYLAHGDIPPSGRGLLAVTIDSFEFIPEQK